ncbi:hypothetical protein BKA63DRAFT_378615, partial [Paraphoma chrysanthemicola]
MGCARISMCCLIAKILPSTIPRNIALGLATFTILWIVSGIIAVSFACGLPRPWAFLEHERCLDMVRFVNYIGITSIVAETILIAIPLILWNLYFIKQSTLSDPTYDRWADVLCTQIAQNLAIISACSPCFHPLILRMLAGTVESDTISVDFSKASFIKKLLD